MFALFSFATFATFAASREKWLASEVSSVVSLPGLRFLIPISAS
ncbi:MAG: hypothetical protein QOC81_2662 [Thermoanaerobaculia bacterium]|nr:hypothetical protein [Thermoanaerobaculia bacterium]